MKRFDPTVGKAFTLDEYIADCAGGLPSPGLLKLEWERLPIVEDKYDSRIDTISHIARVRELLVESANELLRRGSVHDDSKLVSPEKELFDEYTPKLKGSTYGSEEYKGFLKELKVALDHHYANNSHHPEHYENGVEGFDLFDLIEMFMDWKAAGERHENGNIYKSIEINKDRFSLSDQLVSILTNTAKRLNW